MKSQPFVILIGPSGVGKSTVIRRLVSRGNKFRYVTPYTDRPLRLGETDKISVSRDEFTDMENEGKFVAVNHHFSYRYGTPKDLVVEIINSSKMPILDMQLSGIKTLSYFADILLKIYIAPPNMDELLRRLNNEGRNQNDRFLRGEKEISELSEINFQHIDIDFLVVNSDIDQTVNEVLKIISRDVKSKDV